MRRLGKPKIADNCDNSVNYYGNDQNIFTDNPSEMVLLIQNNQNAETHLRGMMIYEEIQILNLLPSFVFLDLN